MQKFIDQMPPGYSNYVKVCLDPFHDKNIRFEGAPTSRSATSVVLCLNQEMTIAADDFTLISEDTWDAHVIMYPMLSKQSVSWANELNYDVAIDPPNDTWLFYPLTVQGINSGNPTYSTSDYASSTVKPQTKGLDCSSLLSYLTGSTHNGPGRRILRMVGSSFEVVNESPEIYTQGAVTVYRYPLNVTPCNRILTYLNPTGSTVNTVGTNIPTTVDAYMVEQRMVTELRSPPSNQANAVLVPGSTTWKARDGCYVVATQYENEIPFVPVSNSNLLVTGYTPTTDPKHTGLTARYSFGGLNLSRPIQACYRSTGPQDPPDWGVPQNAFFPFNLSGAYFTGLSRQFTALRLRYKVFVEVLTDPCDNTLAPLASPTLPYNQELQELVMKVLAELPPGVPQTWNPDGEAWRSALATLGKVALLSAGPLDTLLPGAGEVAKGVGMLARAGSQLGKKKARPKATAKVGPTVKASGPKPKPGRK